MPNKDALIKKLMSKPAPKNFTMRELDALMRKCGCRKFSGGRGSGIGYLHEESGRVVQFDAPHPGNELYRYHVNMVKAFFEEIGEVKP
ncbi:MAG: type II toxin-antitoxin system HicA family toxin [Lachnospiraceae bacterium]|nr:type II toxin-antitoxin system HicA family toxin [Lachnospiraceae bacterium]